MTAPCPTPGKRRYATQRGAEADATRIAIPLGHLMRPYDCGCGWWHLTSRPASPTPKEKHMSYPELLTPEEKLADAKERLGLPIIVVLCGSTTFMDEFTETNLRQTAMGRIVLSVGCNLKEPHELWADPAERELLKAGLDRLHRAKIRLADQVIVVGTRVGDSTRAEIAYARELGKPVRFLHPEADPARAVLGETSS